MLPVRSTAVVLPESPPSLKMFKTLIYRTLVEVDSVKSASQRTFIFETNKVDAGVLSAHEDRATASFASLIQHFPIGERMLRYASMFFCLLAATIILFYRRRHVDKRGGNQ